MAQPTILGPVRPILFSKIFGPARPVGGSAHAGVLEDLILNNDQDTV